MLFLTYNLEARTGFAPVYAVLQTAAYLLGHRADNIVRLCFATLTNCNHVSYHNHKKMSNSFALLLPGHYSIQIKHVFALIAVVFLSIPH